MSSKQEAEMLKMLKAKYGVVDFDKLTAVEADKRVKAVKGFVGAFDGLNMVEGKLEMAVAA